MSNWFAPARRGVAAVVLVAVAAVASAACSQVEDRLNAEDRNRFIEASNGLVDTFGELDSRYAALGAGEIDVEAFVAAAGMDLAAMETRVDELDELAADVRGDARDVARALVEAAEDVVEATTGIVAAITAADETALLEGIGAAEAAVAEFNSQIDAWDEL